MTGHVKKTGDVEGDDGYDWVVFESYSIYFKFTETVIKGSREILRAKYNHWCFQHVCLLDII